MILPDEVFQLTKHHCKTLGLPDYEVGQWAFSTYAGLDIFTSEALARKWFDTLKGKPNRQLPDKGAQYAAIKNLQPRPRRHI